MSVVLHLIRHGQSTANRERRIAGWTDAPLTDRGRDEARRLKDLLTPSDYASVWSSDLSRARDTALLAGLVPREDPRLRELNFGDLEGVHWPDVAEQHGPALANFESFTAPNGEPVPEMRDRIFDLIGELPTGRHALFCHGGVIRIVLASFGTHRFVANCTVVKVDWTTRVLLSEEPLPRMQP